MSICVGCGLNVNDDGILEVERKPGGGVGCDDAGIFVESGTIGITTDDSGTIDFSGTGSSSSHLSASVRISTDACNGLTTGSDSKLFTHCPDSIVLSNSLGFTGGSPPFSINTGGSGTFNLVTSSTVHFCNDICCTVSGYWEFIAYGGVITGASADFEATGFLSVKLDGGGFGGTPLTNKKFYGDADKTIFELGGYLQKDFISMAHNDCHDISAQFTLVVASGSATWAVGPEFEYYIHLTQTGCC